MRSLVQLAQPVQSLGSNTGTKGRAFADHVKLVEKDRSIDEETAHDQRYLCEFPQAIDKNALNLCGLMHT
jgi:ABC-type phosphate transport system substrate-binding protein